MCLTRAEQRGRVTSLGLLTMLLLMQPRRQLAAFAARAQYELIFNLMSNRTLSSFFAELLSSQSASSMYWGIESDVGLVISLC